MPISKKQLGARGEEAAARFLKTKGYQIRERNWRHKSGEIDIVAVKTRGFFGREIDCLVFVEVKTGWRSGDGFLPEQHVDYFKRRCLVRAAKSYIQYKRIPPDAAWRIDVVAIDFNQASELCDIRHYENAVWDG